MILTTESTEDSALPEFDTTVLDLPAEPLEEEKKEEKKMEDSEEEKKESPVDDDLPEKAE